MRTGRVPNCPSHSVWFTDIAVSLHAVRDINTFVRCCLCPFLGKFMCLLLGFLPRRSYDPSLFINKSSTECTLHPCTYFSPHISYDPSLFIPNAPTRCIIYPRAYFLPPRKVLVLVFMSTLNLGLLYSKYLRIVIIFSNKKSNLNSL